MRLRLALACAFGAPLLIAAKEPLRLQPSTDWVVDFAENSCRISRMFGEGSRQTKLSIESFAMGDETMVATGRPLDEVGSDLNVPTRFLPLQQKPFYGHGATTTSGAGAVYWDRVPFAAEFKEDGKRLTMKEMMRAAPKHEEPKTASDLVKEREDRKAFIATASALEIAPQHGRSIVLESGPLGEVMDAFDQCGRDLLKTLGIDADVQDRIAVPLRAANRGAWFNADDYPTKSMVRNEESDVLVRILVDAQGKVTKCDPFSQYNAPEFNAVVCAAIVQKAKFYPAQLADGTKVASFMVQHITFRLDD